MSLDAPSLVHEAYLRFAKQGAIETAQRGIFFAYAAQVMRTVIVDYVRERHAHKRGGGEAMITLTTGIPGTSIDEDSIEQLHEALQALAKIDRRSHFVVELRYFGGMREQEIAELLNVSVPTVKRDWRKARAFLFDALGNDTPMNNASDGSDLTPAAYALFARWLGMDDDTARQLLLARSEEENPQLHRRLQQLIRADRGRRRDRFHDRRRDR